MNPLRWASKIEGLQPTARKPPDAKGIRGFTLAAEKYVFPGGAGENIHLILFQRLRALEVCDAGFYDTPRLLLR